MQTVEEFDLESMKELLGDSTVELPDEINVHWQDYDSHWDCTIKYISTYGAGFPRSWKGYKCCRINVWTKCTMPDGTVFDTNDGSYGLTRFSRIRTFVNKIVDWADKHAKPKPRPKSRPKLRLAADEVEFMDI